jgi:DNA-binding MarR family transcriptional regulator
LPRRQYCDQEHDEPARQAYATEIVAQATGMVQEGRACNDRLRELVVTTRGERKDRLSAEEAATWRGFLEAHARAVAQLDRALAESGCALDLREYDLLVHLNEAGAGGLRLRDLAARALINRSNVTRRVETLVGRGFVERLADPADGRGVIARLTPVGRQTLRRAAAVHIPDVKRLVFHDSSIDLAMVRRFFDDIRAGSSDAANETPAAT